MTDDDKALVERLRTNQCADNMGCNPLAPYCQCAFMDDAADRIEALSAENERLNAIVADRLLGSSVDHRTFKDIIAENERLRGFATNKTDELANILEAGEGIRNEVCSLAGEPPR